MPSQIAAMPRPSAKNSRATGPRPERTERGAGRRFREDVRERFVVLRERELEPDLLRELDEPLDVLLLREPGGEDVRVAMVRNLGHRHTSHTDHTPLTGLVSLL
jgi:hypothetical protein